MNVSSKIFGNTGRGEKVSCYTITNNSGMSVSVLDFGGIIQSVKIPSANGGPTEITLGMDNVASYETESPFFGAAVGRFGNRIAEAHFCLDGKEYDLPVNNGINHLHGGPGGFHQKMWSCEKFTDSDKGGLILKLSSKDGEEGYPGNLEVTMKYTVTEANELIFEYEAETDKATPVNLTNHTYWNLSGPENDLILNHKVMLNCPFYLPVDDNLIPTGEILSVKNTPFDFLQPKLIGKEIQNVKGGYDHCYVRQASDDNLAADVTDEKSGRRMKVYTNQPGMQFYTGNFINHIKGADNLFYEKHNGFCVETQKFPDSPNQPHFPGTILYPGETYSHVTRHEFFW